MNSKYYLSQKSFVDNKFCVVRKFINPDIAVLLYNYAKVTAQAVSFKIDHCKEKYDDAWDGNFHCPQALGVYSKYGDSIMDALGIQTLLDAQVYTGHKLYYTYSYWRLYENGSILKSHRDRMSCDISATICLGWDNSNLSQNYNWSFFVESNGQEIEIKLNPGDAVFYRGCDLLHWRNKCECLNHAQVFLHYNSQSSINEYDATTGDGYLYDGRVCLGLPKKYQTKDYPESI